jgi:hypothetical protein
MNALATSHPHPPQHLRALAQANAVRLKRAELKRRIADGETNPGEVFLSSPWEAASMSVSDVLKSQRRWGSTRCRKFLSPLRISENKPVGSLTQRQRRALSDHLAGREVEPAPARMGSRRLAAV